MILKSLMEGDIDGSCSILSPKIYSTKEALALMLDCRINRAFYQNIPQGYRLYPASSYLVKVKGNFLPESLIEISNYSASVSLQG